MKKIPFDEYKALPGLNPSAAKLIRKSPEHVLAAMAEEMADTAALRFGRLVHELALEGHHDSFAVAPECDKRTKAGKELWAEFEAAADGKAIVTASEFADASAMVERIAALNIPLHDDREVSVEWTQGGVSCKTRIDALCPERVTVYDIKTTDDASPEAFGKAATDYGYDIQAAGNLIGLQAKGIDATEWVAIACEKKWPFAVRLYRMPDEALAQGIELWNKAVRAVAAGRPAAVPDIELPAWYGSAEHAF